jgi:hypothetical protein
VAYLQELTFALRHQAGSLNRVADALSHRTLLLTTISTKVAGFDAFTDMYATDPSFGKIIQEVKDGHRSYFICIMVICFVGYSCAFQIVH